MPNVVYTIYNMNVFVYINLTINGILNFQSNIFAMYLPTCHTHSLQLILSLGRNKWLKSLQIYFSSGLCATLYINAVIISLVHHYLHLLSLFYSYHLYL